MGIIDNAVTRALEIAADDSHGYDQTSRWGPDYDCSSLVISAFKKAGVPLSCTYTGNMRSDMLRHGFEDVTGSVDLATGGQTGDQTGREIYTRGYYNYPWNTVLRYKGSSGTVPDISPVISQLDRNITVSLPELKSGDIDVSVAMLQAALKYKGYNPRWVDGEFGAQTGAALKAFQADHGLDADTICGKATWNEITKA